MSCMRQTTLLNLKHPAVLLARPISHTSTQCMDLVEIFNISLDLSTIYFVHFTGCWASFVYSCDSTLCIVGCWASFVYSCDSTLCIVGCWASFVYSCDSTLCIVGCWASFVYSCDSTLCIVGCWASFVYSCDSILECYNPFSGVKLSIRYFHYWCLVF